MTEPARQDNEPENPAAGAPEPAAEPQAAPAETPADPLAQKDAEIAQLTDRLLRALAETENTRKRAERDREDAARFAVGNFARDMLAVADNLKRAVESVPADAKSGNTALATLLEGVDLTDRQLQSLFEKHGIQRLAPLDQAFDPNLHQAMFEVPGTGKPAGTVVQVLQPGFTIHGRLLRPALVGLAKAEPAA